MKEFVVEELLKLVLKAFVFPGLVLYIIYIINTVVWPITLSKTILSFVYPFAALIFVLATLSARIVFLEPISTLRYLGILLINLGFLLSSFASDVCRILSFRVKLRNLNPNLTPV